jgi:methylenetetrahydrofolate reductase (NADPH)
LRKALENYGDDEASLKAFGTELVTELCDTLLENGAPGLHFYTMNLTDPTAEIVRNLGLIPTE